MDVIEYLKSKGQDVEIRGGHIYIKSLFKPETTPSLCIYPTLTWYDWSTHQHGSIQDIMRMFGDEPKEVVYALKERKAKEFSMFDYLDNNEENVQQI